MESHDHRFYMQMLNDRGYLVKEEDRDMSKERFKEILSDEPNRDDLTILTQKKDSESEEVRASF